MIKMRSTVAVLATLALTATLSTSALATSEPEPQELTGIEWSLTSIAVDGATSDVPDGVSATLFLEAGDATGSAGCNDFFGGYSVDGPLLSFGPLGATRMFCEGPQHVVEDAYLAALGAVAYWAIADDGSLSLRDESQTQILSFSEVSGGIEGISWLLRSQAVGDTQAATPEGILVSLRMEDGQAGGNGGCNRYSTSYLIDGPSISFGDIASTLMACQDPAGTVESDYFANLAAVTAWQSDGATLTLAGADGASLLQYDAAPEASVVGSWVAQGINNGVGGVVSSTTTSAITADYVPDGDLTGFDGCNEYFTTYEVDGDAIMTSGAIGSTRMACTSDELAEQSQWYYAALGAATTWSINDAGNLQLRDDGGSLQVEYTPAAG